MINAILRHPPLALPVPRDLAVRPSRRPLLPPKPLQPLHLHLTILARYSGSSPAVVAAESAVMIEDLPGWRRAPRRRTVEGDRLTRQKRARMKTQHPEPSSGSCRNLKSARLTRKARSVQTHDLELCTQVPPSSILVPAPIGPDGPTDPPRPPPDAN